MNVIFLFFEEIKLEIVSETRDKGYLKIFNYAK